MSVVVLRIMTTDDLDVVINILQNARYHLQENIVSQPRRPPSKLLHHHHWLDRSTWALAFLRSFCQLKYSAIASSDFVTRSFPRWGCQPQAQTSAISEGRCFLSGLSPLADYSQFQSVRISRFGLSWLSRINVAQEPWCEHASNGFGRNKWHYWSFVSLQLSAKCIASRPRTTPSAPIKII
jgi:hypothetical protein